MGAARVSEFLSRLVCRTHPTANADPRVAADPQLFANLLQMGAPHGFSDCSGAWLWITTTKLSLNTARYYRTH